VTGEMLPIRAPLDPVRSSLSAPADGAAESTRQGVRCGAPGRIRTADASLRTAALYPLSYGGARGWYPDPGEASGTSTRMPGEMIEPARPTAEAVTPLPDLILYAREGCHLCDEARDILAALLAERSAAGRDIPRLIERDITTNEGWERAFTATIPVVEFGSRRLELATSAARLRRLLAD
jgi:hypothetical protein